MVSACAKHESLQDIRIPAIGVFSFRFSSLGGLGYNIVATVDFFTPDPGQNQLRAIHFYSQLKEGREQSNAESLQPFLPKARD
ncbi:MAG: hypothetical protein ACJAQT_001691 [Akkermansiaceae bacterium]|jgi:hypothetical protein